MQPHPILKTARLILRPLVREDAEALHPTFADAATMRWIGHPHRSVEQTRAAFTDWAAARAATRAAASPFRRAWAIRLDEPDQPDRPAIGSVTLRSIHIPEAGPEAGPDAGPEAGKGPGGCARIGFVVADGWRGRGYVPEAVAAVIGYAFTGLGLHRIALHLDPGNAGGLRVAEKLGFTPEGRTRRSARIGDEWRDEAIFGLLVEEWRRHGR